MSLQEQIDTARADIRTDSYSMSIGEWISLYESEEVYIYPEFQRFYRWSSFQKSRLVESILLGIPIPPIFVAQREDGVWDVVDGLQRLSTIYELVGMLRNEEGARLPPLVLEPTKYLPNLKGKRWESEREQDSLTSAQRLLIKRAKIDVSIILKESDEASKYELFQRLNTGGSPLSAQEVRNSILVMLNRDMYRWMRDLSRYDPFTETVALTDKAIDEQYDMELVLRFLILREINLEELTSLGDIGEFLSDQMMSIAAGQHFDEATEAAAFQRTFDLLNEEMEADAFRRYDASQDRFLGGFILSAYEAVAMGVGFHIESMDAAAFNVTDRVKQVWQHDSFARYSGSGVRASSRLPKLVELGRDIFAP